MDYARCDTFDLREDKHGVIATNRMGTSLMQLANTATARWSIDEAFVMAKQEPELVDYCMHDSTV